VESGDPEARSMNRMVGLLWALYNDESGQDLIEYALIATLVALVAITGLNGLASSISSEYNSITSRFGTAVG
jgi:pilus assembly protein Flp/PilA